ncbi:MAG: trigger factor, partial [Erysipelotrichaceae bacterium]|nr:trigger factor [Erysipelotrichaceae bacterium]
VTFPEDYHAEDLKGAEAVFHVVLHEIKTKVLPELDDEFVKSLTIENVETVEQLKDHYKNSLLENKQNDAENKATSQLLDKLNDIAEIDVPAVMVDHELDEQIERYSQQLQSQGLSLDMFLQVTNQTLEQLKESQRDAALRNVRMNLILDEIAKREELVPAEEDYGKEYQKWADMYEMKIDDIKAVLNKDMLKDNLTHRKVLDYLRRK